MVWAGLVDWNDWLRHLSPKSSIFSGVKFAKWHKHRSMFCLSLYAWKEWAQTCWVSVHVLSRLARSKLRDSRSYSENLEFLSSQIFKISEKDCDVLFCSLCLEKRSSNCLRRRWYCISLLLGRNDDNTFLLQNLRYSLDSSLPKIDEVAIPCLISFFPFA